MATDEREYHLHFAPSGLDGEDFALYATPAKGDPHQADSGLTVVPKSRAVAAEQRVRELEEGKGSWISLAEHKAQRAEYEKRIANLTGPALEAAEAKLATAVEALRKTAAALEFMRVSEAAGQAGADNPIVLKALEVSRQALSKIEGDE